MKLEELSNNNLIARIKEAKNWKKRDLEYTHKYEKLFRQAESRRKSRRILAFSMSASAVLFILLLIAWPNFKSGFNPEILFDEYYHPYHFQTTYRDGSKNVEPFNKALIAYENRDWMEALSISDSILRTNPSNPNIKLLRASVLMASGNYREAEQQFNKILLVGGSYEQHSRWYLAMIYLKEGKLSNCIDQLKVLSLIEKSTYQIKSKKLLRKMH